MVGILFSFLVSMSASAGQSVPAGCLASPNFSAEAYQAWAAEGSKHAASGDEAQSKVIPTGKHVELQLLPLEDGFTGFAKFEISEEGDYIIVTDAYPHIDVKDLKSGESLSPSSFGKVRDCGTVSKVLRFDFSKGGKYQLGFESRQGQVLNVLIWRLSPK